MYLKKKNRILENFWAIKDLIANSEMLNLDYNMHHIQNRLYLISEILRNEEIENEFWRNYSDKILDEIEILSNKNTDEKLVAIKYELLNRINELKQEFLNNVKVKLNVLFMPYNITMWDSLESIYLACKNDKDCDVKVVPIPFFDLTQSPPVRHFHLEQYDKAIDVIDYNSYNLKDEEPDVIYIHNAYDDGNILTTVLPKFYTSKLKKHTDMLVFSPYATPNFTKDYFKITKHRSFTFNGRGTTNIDRFVSAGDFVRKEGLQLGINDRQILNYGCPKFDSLIQQIDQDYKYPAKWVKNKDKKIVVFATGISYFIRQIDLTMDRITNAKNVIQEFTNILSKYKENDIFVIWRPHPLTKNFINRVNPEMIQWYEKLCNDISNSKSEFENIALDTSESFLPAFKISDALLTDGSSIVYSYLLLNKKLFLMTNGIVYKAKKKDIDKEKLEFLLEEGTFNLNRITNFKKQSELKIDDSFLKEFYKNLDGTVGQKIHDALKTELLYSSENK